MLQKWKQILTNWVNCYFNENNKNVHSVTLESLLNIISHLRENLNLDESKSSVLEAHTVEEFITEKYPEFQFENVTVEASNEDGLYVVASLLLFFVCVSSKDVNLKNAMCSTLNSEDQKVILKFSKALMVCSPITLRDVQAAITEACGQEIAAMESNSHISVAETPPALRSLHSEVRRLHAALDAERFDRNYLQEELSRTNMRMENLLKDKEQYKLEIVNLKAKISLCGQESETLLSDDNANGSAKLTQQLQEMEEWLVQVQCQLDDVVYERDTYKSKLEELKQDRDKWFSLSQQESARVTQLGEELDTERRQVNSLRELVTELRQHNKLNGLDSSMLECDDPDASIQSLQQNLSVCSEVCANVVEVQLGEERAKIIVLKQNIHTLQEQINELNHKAENDKLTYETILSEKDRDIMNLKHRINEEIEDKNVLKAYFNDEVSKLNNEINELEQILKDNNDNSRLAIEKKMQEIQILQEEKLSLLHSLSDETTKLESIIKQLKTDLDSEKQSKRTMKDSYENQIMKLKEKVLNRNNELVELQNNVLEKSEMIESLHLDLRKERELKDELSNKYYNDMSELNEQKNSLENKLSHLYEETNDLQTKLKEQTKLMDELNNDIDRLNMTLSDFNENYRILEESKNKLLADKEICDHQLEESNKQLYNQKTLFRNEKDKLLYSLDEKNAIVNSLQVQLQNEIQFKVLLQDELSQLQNNKTKLNEENNKLNADLSKFNTIINEKDKTIDAMDMYLQDEKNKLEKLKLEYDEQLKDYNETVQSNEQSIKLLKEKLHNNEELLKLTNDNMTKEKETSESNNISLKIEKENISKEKCQLHQENTQLQSKIEALTQDAEEHYKKLSDENAALSEMRKMCEQKEVQVLELHTEIKRLQQVVSESKIELSKRTETYDTSLESKTRDIQTLQQENQSLHNDLNDVKLQLELKVHSLKEKLVDNEHLTDKLKGTYECQIENLNLMITKLTNYLRDKSAEMEALRKEKERLQQNIEENNKAIKSLEDEVKAEKAKQEKFIEDFESERLVLKSMVTVTESVMDDQKISLNKVISEHLKANEALKDENNVLKQSIESEKQKLVVKLQEKETALESIFKELAEVRNAKEGLEIKVKMQKDDLKNEISSLKEELNSKQSAIEALKTDENNLSDIISKYEKAIKSLEDEVKEEKGKQEKIFEDFESERLVLRNMVTVAESVMYDQKISLNKVISEHLKANEVLKDENIVLKQSIESEKQNLVVKLQEKETALESIMKELAEVRNAKEGLENKVIMQKDDLNKEISSLKEELNSKQTAIEALKTDKKNLSDIISKYEKEITFLEDTVKAEKAKQEKVFEDFESERLVLRNMVTVAESVMDDQKISLNKVISEHLKANEVLKDENIISKQSIESEKQNLVVKLQEKETALESIMKELAEIRNAKKGLENKLKTQKDDLNKEISSLKEELNSKQSAIEALKTDENNLSDIISKYEKAIKSLEDEVKAAKAKQEKIFEDFESERLVLRNMVTVAESVMYDQKISLNKVISEHLKANEVLKDENIVLKQLIESEKQNLVVKLQEKETALESLMKELAEVRNAKEGLENKVIMQKDDLNKEISSLKDELNSKKSAIEALKTDKKNLSDIISKYEKDLHKLEENNNELKIKNDDHEVELGSRVYKLTNELDEHKAINSRLQATLDEKNLTISDMQSKIESLKQEINNMVEEKNKIELQKNKYVSDLEAVKTKLESQTLTESNGLITLKTDNAHLIDIIEGNKTVIKDLELLAKNEIEKNQQLRESNVNEKQNLVSKCSILQEYQIKAEKVLEDRQKDINTLNEEIKTLNSKVHSYEQQIKIKDDLAEVIKEKDAIISTISKELLEEKSGKERYKNELESVYELKKKLDEMTKEQLKHLRLENEEMLKVIGQRETFAVLSQEKTSSHKYLSESEKELRNLHQQVDNISSDITHSSMESFKTISDLEKIIHDKNRMITTLQSDITYMKTLMAESENKLLDVTKDLEVSKENCLQLSNQLKKIVYMKNEEIAELKRQVAKMSVTENRASQIIKVSAKYQAIILKRIAEIKSNTVLKELTNFGNSNNCDNELRRGLNAGTITMEDLENFLETTDKHLKRCSEKQLALQKERDRLTEVNRINESEIINLKKFLTELSVSFQTFSSMKDLYAQKLSRVILVQRTVRREILNLEGQITDATMCKLERGYAAVMQDLSECALNLERWVERCIGRTISPEKIKQSFMSDDERTSLASVSFQNAGLEVQLGELENSFQKLLEEVARAQKGEGAKDVQAVTVMEVRAEYEDKLNRMKAKMKQLYQEQIAVFMEKQRDEISTLERELQKSRDKLAASSRKYEEHIRALTQELWSVGEKFLMKKDEAEWLRRRQRSGSLMSLQHVHSSGLVPTQEEPSQPSDSHSLRSLPMANNNNKREGRGLHMSDEEGEVFDNRCLKELAATPKREIHQQHSGLRLSELRYRNSLCLPHLKSSYPAETQFAAAVDEEDIKCNVASSIGGKPHRKEVGITAYKKPGPPTPSKQAGRLSATDSELRESLRVEAEPQPGRKTSTPSRIRALFRSARNDTVEGTPRSRRLSSIFRKK